MNQTCRICKIDKPATPEYFYRSKRRKNGLVGECKHCRDILRKKYYIDNQEKLRRNGRERYHNNREEELAKNKTYREANRERLLSINHPANTDSTITQKCRECGDVLPATLEYFHRARRNTLGVNTLCKTCANIKAKEWRLQNPLRHKAGFQNWINDNKEYAREYHNKYKLNKYHSDENYRVHNLIASGIHIMLSGKAKQRSSMEYVGCSIEELVDHLNSSRPDNSDNLHIDHIIPKSMYDTTDSDLKKCWNYRNLRYLDAKENLSKGNELCINLVEEYDIYDLLPDSILFSQIDPETGESTCQKIHRELKSFGMDAVTAQHADLAAQSRYSGGGRSDVSVDTENQDG